MVSSVAAVCSAGTDAQVAEWTVLVYLDGDNNLDKYSVTDVEEMMGVGSTEKVKVLVLWDRLDAPVYLYEVHPDGLDVISGLTVNDIELNGEEVHMANPAILDAFVDFGTAMYPSEHLMVVLWDHGSPLYGVCRDDHFDYPWYPFQSYLSYEDVGYALMGHEVDVLAFDSCSGGMAEIAYLYGQMGAYQGLEVDHIVASEIYVPAFGYPYDRILLQMNSMPVYSEVVDVATMIAEEYADSYIAGSPGNGGNTASLSVISPGGMFDSIDAVKDLTALLQTRLETDYDTYKPLISEARGDANLIWGVAGDYGFVDFPMFLKGLSKTPGDKELRASANALLTTLQTEVVLYVGNADAAESGTAMGLGVLFPPTYVNNEYPVIYMEVFFDFGRESGWLDFTEAYWST
jgi:hypothetical protein